nr:MAG TPA: hypothetical protein [Caudoviricetes sp.]
MTLFRIILKVLEFLRKRFGFECLVLKLYSEIRVLIPTISISELSSPSKRRVWKTEYG